jgi:hypothetical protein
MTTPAGHRSDDGQWVWNGTQWVADPQPVPGAATSHTSATPARRYKEYKVLTQKDRFFAGKFDPAKLEGALNG